MKKIILSAAILILGIGSTKAQFEISNLSVGAGAAPSMYFAEGLGTFTTSFSAKLQYEADENFYYGDFIYSSKKFDDLDNTTLLFNHINAGIGRYFVGSSDDDFSMAGKIGAGISMYYFNYDGAMEEVSDASWNINGGVLATYSISDAIKLFGEVGAIVSAGTYNSQSNGTASPEFNNAYFQVGAKFRFQ
jgi:hypothetical protein